jgi:hypothetical protein
MASGSKIALLIEELRRLYRQMAALVLKKRVGSYREDAPDSTASLSASLRDQVGDMARARDDAGKREPVTADGTHDALSVGQPAPKRQGAKPQGGFVSRLLKGFPSFIQRQKKSPTLQPHLSQQLKNSAWEHVHTAIRLARQGEAAKARLHVDIAMSALSELAHYMPEVEYQQFRAEVKAQIDNIRELSD